MIRYLRTALYALLAGAAVCGVAWVLVASPWLRYTELQIEGNRRAGVAELRHLANLPQADPMVLLDLSAAVAGVERHPWVESASARRQFPNAIVLTVRERVPVALLHLQGHDSVAGFFLVRAAGTVFARAAQPADYDHPILTGLDPELVAAQPEVARRLVREGLAWLSAAQEQGGLPESSLSELHFDARTGYTLNLRNGGDVLLGFADRTRVARLPALVASGLDLSTPHRIDLASDRLAVVTPL